jgi:hypothetical protein
MKRSFAVLASAVTLLGGLLFVGCWTDPDSPDTWLAQLNESPFKRKEALVNLYRIHETSKALSKKKGATGKEYAKKLEAFRKKVNPALIKAFDKKIRNKHVAPQEVLEHLIMFKSTEAAPLYRRIIQEYVAGETDKYGNEDTQEGLVAKALTGLSALAEMDKAPPEAMDDIESLVKKICVKHSGKTVVEGADPRSFIRNAIVKAMPPLIEALPEKKKVAGRLLSRILDYGFGKGEVQDPMVNIFAGRSLGDVGDTSPATIEALVTALYRKGRGRAFHPYCTVALAKLPAGSDGRHPAVKPLRWLLKGDPWERTLRKLKRNEKSEKKNKKEIETLETALESGKKMPPCPEEIPSKYNYVCKIYWTSRIEKWEEKEPGVVELNSIITLREIGDVGKDAGALADMLAFYGSDALEKKWFSKMDEKKDRYLPRVQNQRMQIKGYGKDMNIRMEFLFAAGRLGHIKKVEGLRRELIRSLSWSGDPGSMLKAAEAIARAPYDETLLKELVTKVDTVDTWIGHAFKHRMFKHASWAKAQKQCMEAKPALDKKWNECTSAGDTAEECFKKFRKDFWLPELKKIVGYFEPNDVKDAHHKFCKEEDEAKEKEPACKETLTKLEKERGVPVCNEWGPCNAEKFYTCLDGDQELRLQFALEAMRAATPKELALLTNMEPEKFLRLPRRSLKSFPKKDTTYYDPTDRELRKDPYAVIPKKMAKARRKKAIETVKRRLCEMSRRLDVVKECQYDVNCYIATLKGENVTRYTDKDCSKPDQPGTKAKKVGWQRKEKAAYMLAVLGKKPAQKEMAIRALCGSYEDASVGVRKAILLALDRIADSRHAKKEDMGKKIIDVVDDETSRRVKGVWQINRDARSCIGRMRRRKPSS